MTPIAVLTLAVAVWVWPASAAPSRRLSSLARPTSDPSVRTQAPIRLVGLLALSVGLLVALLVSATPGIIAGVLTTVAVWRTGQRLPWQGRSAQVDPWRLAAAWDLLAACLRTGMPVPDAVRAIADHLPTETSATLHRVAVLLALGSDPVEAWRPAISRPETAELARAARRTTRSGAALAGVAAGLADTVRQRTYEAAESRAQRAAVLIAGPLGLCFLPAFLCLGIVPVVLGLAGRLEFLG